MAKTKKPQSDKPSGEKKKSTAAKRPRPQTRAKKEKGTPTVQAPNTSTDALAKKKVENPLLKVEPKKSTIATLAAETAGMSTLERVIHFFARHDESDKEPKKLDENKEEEIDPEAFARGDVPMSFVDHLGEFRSRLLMCALFFLILTVAGFVFSDELLAFINKPFIDTGLKLNVFKLSEGFMMRLKVSAIAALVAGLPFLIFQVWRFILPAITKKDRWFGRLSLLASILLFYTGIAFVYFLLMPFTVKMLLSFVAKDIASVIGATEYINFVFLFCFLMGVLFEFPILIMLLTRIGIVTPYMLSSNRKWAIIVIFIISAVITPTQDILTQSLVAIPLMFLFEMSIIISKMTVVRKKKKDLEQEKQDR